MAEKDDMEYILIEKPKKYTLIKTLVIAIIIILILFSFYEYNMKKDYFEGDCYSHKYNNKHTIIEEDINWDNSKSPIYINSSLLFKNNSNIYISSGVKVIINRSIDLVLKGNLIALGNNQKHLQAFACKSKHKKALSSTTKFLETLASI